MRNTIKKIFVGMLTMAVMFIMSSACYAGTRDYMQTISLPSNQAWTTAGSGHRSGNFTFVIARTHSVFPNSGVDNLYQCQCKITDTSGTRVCEDNYHVLDEMDSGYTHIPMREGYADTKDILFKFRSDNNNSANAVVSYSAC